MPAYPKIAVVILNWNGVQLLDKFLPSVVRNSSGENIEVYIADNGSDDNSVEFITKNYESIHCIKLNKNLGFAEGYNTALKQVKAEYFVLLNSDVEVTPNWINKCMELFNSNDNIAAIQPKIISFEKAHLFEYAGAAGGFIDKFGYPFCRGRILNKMEADVGQYNKETPIFWASGACMFIKSDAFKKAGGFDADQEISTSEIS